MQSKIAPRVQIKKDLKEGLLHEGGGMINEDSTASLAPASKVSTIEERVVDGLDVFTEPATRKMFEDLALRTTVKMGSLDIVNVLLTLDSKYALVILEDVAASSDE